TSALPTRPRAEPKVVADAVPANEPGGVTIGGLPSDGESVQPAASGPASSTKRAPRWRERIEAYLPAVVGVWLIGVVVMGTRLVRGLIEVRALTRRGLVAPTGELQDLIGRLVERSGLRRPVSWFMSLRVEVPTVVGWLRPTVLIPAGNMARLTLGQ